MKNRLTSLLLLIAFGIALHQSTLAQNAASQPSSNGVPRTLLNEKGIEVFTTPSHEAIPYRIPAIAQNRKGELIAVADYRYSRSDIGAKALQAEK